MDSYARLYAVYMHIVPNDKRYIGITCQGIARRWGKGGQGYKKCPYFWQAITKYGWDNIAHQVLFTGLSETEAKQCEKDLIVAHKTRDSAFGYNLTDGGDGACGVVKTAETRAKLSAANSGENCSAETRAKRSAALKGRVLSDETKAMLSAAQKGKTAGAGTRAKMSAARMHNQFNFGHKASDAVRAKMSEAQKGRTMSDETKNKLRVMWNRLTKKVERLTMDGAVVARYASIMDAVGETGVSRSNIQHACRGRHKTAGGFKWRYV